MVCMREEAFIFEPCTVNTTDSEDEKEDEDGKLGWVGWMDVHCRNCVWESVSVSVHDTSEERRS